MDTGNNFVLYKFHILQRIDWKKNCKNHVDHLQEKKSPIKDEIYLDVQLEKWDLHRNETAANSRYNK